jgi:3-dehydroquinate dehydratase/shikimate dehydrogenase
MRQLTPMAGTQSIPMSSLAPAAPLRIGKVCVALQGGTPAELLSRAEAALADAKFVEFRLDFLPKPGDFIAKLAGFLAQNSDVSAIATCRRKANGGKFAGSLASELDILLQAAQAGCQFVDLEIESAEEVTRPAFKKFREALRATRTSLLISFHDFSRTKGLSQAADRMAAFAPDFVKVVSTAHALADNLAMLKLIEDRSQSTQVVGIAMGEEGLISRVLGPRAGAAFTFAASADGVETAPGQITARTLFDAYRMDQIDLATQLFGVAGNPIAHSLSPLMHNTAFRKEGVNAVLLPLKVRALGDLMKVIHGLPLAGVAVTMPLKQEVLPQLSNMDVFTKRIGACNTLRVIGDGKIVGFNTDVAGIVRPLAKRLKLKGARVAVLGAGGAARAAVFGLVGEGAEVFIVNRTHEKAVALARAAKAKSLKHELLAKTRFDVLINSTPCGMKDSKQALPIKENELNASLVFDMVYNPLDTPLLKLARSRGLHVITGLEMFVQQGARQFEIWTGKPAPEAEMQRVVELELRKRG